MQLENLEVERVDMKKLFLLLILIISVANNVFAQPSVVNTNISGGYVEYGLTDRGVVRAAIVQSSVTSTQQFLFATGFGNYDPKWSGSSGDNFRNVNTFLSGGTFISYNADTWDADHNFNVTSGSYYTFIIGESSVANNNLSILETSYQPQSFTSVSTPGTVYANESLTVTVTMSGTLTNIGTDEQLFIRYTTDAWTSSSFIEITSLDGSNEGTAIIPAQNLGTSVEYYALTSNSLPTHSTADYFTLNFMANAAQNVGGNNFTYTVSSVSTSITGSAGWRILSTPVSGATYASLLDPIWTQGIATGADATFGTSNVQSYNGSALVTVNDLTATMTAGQGFIVYVYGDDDYDTVDDGFPKTLSLSGTENSGPVSVTLTSGVDAWTLAGNPYATTIDADSFTETDVTGVVYVYDHSYTSGGSPDESNASGGAFRAWNGSAGGLTDGLIAPFQGFWVQNAASGTSSLSIPTSAKSTGGTFYKTAATPSLELLASMGSLYSSAYFSFTESASEAMDSRDAFKLTPMDLKNYLSMSTRVEGNSIDINNLPLALANQVRIPLTVDAFEADLEAVSWKTMGGEVTLSWPQVSNIPAGWVVQLEDAETGAVVNLLEESTYTFTLVPTVAKVSYDAKNLGPKQVTAVNSSRFSLVIGPMTTSVKELSELPNSIKLNQNYPNPFNPSTQISFELPQTMTVKLAVYDVMGREIATLVNGAAKAGMNQVNWNASNVGSGMYYYRLVAGDVSITKKMTLVK